jgi:pyruvate/2-oxoacid:ferredoxin oxidoreductase beta subunit
MIYCVLIIIIIEIDGNQHFEYVKRFKNNYIENQKNDIDKMIKAKKEGYSFIRIYQPDIWFNKIDWKEIILKNLYVRNIPNICYFSSNDNKYDEHKKLIKI